MLLALLVLAAAANETPAPPGPVVDCAKSSRRSWTTVRDHRKALAFVAAVKSAGIEFSEAEPFDCGLNLVAQCGPDLDGDGVGDAVVRAQWAKRYPRDGERDSEANESVRCHDPRFRGPSSSYSSMFLLLSQGAPSPMGHVLLLEDETGSGREGPTRIAFTKWQGQAALKLHLDFTHSASGVTDHKERTLVVRDGRMVVVAERSLGSSR